MNANTILKILCNYAEFQVYSKYAEPGYTDPESGIIAVGNWNSRTIRRRVYGEKSLPSWLTVSDPDATEEVEDQTMPRIAAILEKLGAELEWEDEWTTCEECGKLVRTSPDSHGWKRSYWEDGCGAYCRECVKDDPEDYLKYLEGNPGAANTLDLDLGEHGYKCIEEEYENGWHPGQCDDPHKIAESLQKLGVERFIFEIDSVGQFDLSFSVWVHESEYGKLDPDKIESKGTDPAVALKSTLAESQRILS